jgi:hypothetical protein
MILYAHRQFFPLYIHKKEGKILFIDAPKKSVVGGYETIYRTTVPFDLVFRFQYQIRGPNPADLCIDQNLKSKTKFFAQMRIKFYQG